jgi:hypothetical protein
MCWYILRHSHFIHFIFYILHQANFQNRKKKYIFDNNYIIIFYIKIECLKQRFWLLLRYLQTYFLPRIYQNVKIINLCVVQTWKVFDQDVYYTVGMGDYRLQRKTKYISADKGLFKFYNRRPTFVRHHHKLRSFYRNRKALSYLKKKKF